MLIILQSTLISDSISFFFPLNVAMCTGNPIFPNSKYGYVCSAVTMNNTIKISNLMCTGHEYDQPAFQTECAISITSQSLTASEPAL